MMLIDQPYQFSEQAYYSAYKRIRNKFRKYNSLSVIQTSLEYLHHPVKKEFDELEKHPWFVVLLIKWVLQDDNFDTSSNKIINKQEVYKLCQSVFDLSPIARLPNDFDHYTLFFRGMAYQQFFYQEPFSFSNFIRQKQLFNDLPTNNYIQSTFTNSTNLPINKFIELALITLTKFITTRTFVIGYEWYSPLLKKYSQSEVHSFLNVISNDLFELRKIFRNRYSGRRSAQEYFEQTPFIEFPLIRTSPYFICIHPNILYKCLEHFIYDHVKRIDPQKFMDKFGSYFESYVEKILKYSELEYYTETYLKNKLKTKSKIVDFIIPEQDATIFIDAKGVEMAYQGKVSHSSQIVEGKSKVSILKAIEQAHDLLAQIHKDNITSDQIKPTNNNYLIVVTYKEFYLGCGESFYESVGKSKMDEIYAIHSSTQTIPPENMFFITIEEFELLAEHIRAEKKSVSDLLHEAVKDNRSFSTRKFVFKQNLTDWGATVRPTFLDDSVMETFNEFTAILS